MVDAIIRRQEIILFLYDHSPFDSYTAPWSTTLLGLSAHYKLNRTTISNILKSLMDKGLVERSFKHTMDKGMVSDRKRRTCYSLTSDGKEIAKRIKDIRRDLE